MEEEVPLEKLLELGDRHVADKDLDRGIHYYNRALKKDLDAPEINLKLAEAYRLKAEKDGGTYYTLAAETLRRVLKTDPTNEAAHDKLLLLAFKTGDLDALTQEYGEKAKAGPDAEFYAKYLKRACALSVMGSEPKKPLFEYTPAPFMKSFFDFLILPGSNLAIVVSQFKPEFKPFFALGVTMFLFYCAYRVILFLMMRRQ